VPFFIHWPGGKLAHGSDVSDLNAHIDVLPTLIDLCGLKPPREVDFDGRSFREQLTEPGKALPERTLVRGVAAHLRSRRSGRTPRE
jgi:arylsulfatase A-like enzyme